MLWSSGASRWASPKIAAAWGGSFFTGEVGLLAHLVLGGGLEALHLQLRPGDGLLGVAAVAHAAGGDDGGPAQEGQGTDQERGAEVLSENVVVGSVVGRGHLEPQSFF